MAVAEKQVALRKRQQIENAGRTMFMWVAISAALVGLAGVVGVSLFERMVFNQRILSAKNTTVSTLKHNNSVVDELKDNVRLLNTNANLYKTPRLAGSEPISAVLDALPASANAEAFGASLQEKLLNADGVSIDLLSPLSATSSEDSDDESVGEIAFQFSVSTAASNASALKEVLRNLEKSIRAIDITSLTIEQQNNKITLSGEVRTFYQPAAQVELKEKAVKP